MAKLLGQSASFAVAAGLLAATHRTSVTVAVLVTGPVVAAAIILLAVPETSRRELTDLAVLDDGSTTSGGLAAAG
jgi:hypothetical protein